METLKTSTLSQQVLSHLQVSRSDPIADAIGRAVDEGIKKQQAKREKRKYLGASSIGDECGRKIQYRYMNFPQDEGSEFSAKTLRIFEFGHNIEDYVAS